MSWPKPSDVVIMPTRKARQKLQRWTKEETAQMRIERLRREFAGKIERLLPDSERALRSIVSALESDEFAAWFEAKTGRTAESFAAGQVEMLMFGIQAVRGNWFDLVRSAIARIDAIEVVDREWLRSVWSEELQLSTGGKRRRIIMRLATPKWADGAEIMAIYAMRDEISSASGEQHHVDHIVPLQHPLVCGLNVAANLRVVSAVDNMRKSNNFRVGVDG